MSGKRQGGYSLHSVLMGAFLTCVGVLLVFFVLTLVPRVSDLLQQNAVERTKETVLQSVASLDLYISNMLSTMHFASSQLSSAADESPDVLRERLQLMQQSQPNIANIAFFSDDGSLFCSTGGDLRLQADDVQQSEWFQKALEWEGTVTYFSSPHVQQLFANRRSYVITMARKLEYVMDGAWRTGVLLMDIDYVAFSGVVNSISLGTSGYAYLIDDAGELISHPRLQLIYQGLASENKDAALEQIVGFTQDRAGDRDRVIFVSTVEQSRWRLVAVAYLDELVALQNNFIQILSVVIACAAFLALGSASLMAYFVTRPISHLEHKMRSVQDGDLNVTITEKGFREIRAVSAAFNHMLEQIRMLMARVVHEQEVKRLHELNALQAQINPHFLYNTLDSIVWMEERGRSREAITMVLALAKLFRISISKGKRFITVREELEHVRNYLIIQKMRFKDKFVYEMNADDVSLNERTVKLIVQPLVENCINHAIDEAQGTALRIDIRTWVTDSDLFYSIEDDGVGISEELLPTLLTTSNGENGIGVKNVHERIQLTYGSQYGLTIQSVEDEGTKITIRIPRGWEEKK